MLEVSPTEFGFAFEGYVEGVEWLQHDGSPVVKFKSAVENRAYGESRPESLLLAHRDAGGISYL